MTTGSIREAVEDAFQHGPVMLVVDTRAGVVLPEAFHGAPNLRLNFSPKYAPHDLVVDESGVRQTLSFSGQWFEVFVPWAAVLAHRDELGRAGLYVNNLPVEVQERLVLAVFDPIPFMRAAAPKKNPFRIVS